MKIFVLLALIGATAAYNQLTPDEYSLVSTTWATVKHQEVDILYAIFKAYPDIQGKFPQFTGKNLDEIKGTPEFALHATRIISLISEIVALSSHEANNPAITHLVEEFGTNHHNRGVTSTQLNEFRTAFFHYLKDHVSWGDNVEAAWNKAFDNVYGIAFAKL